MEISWLSHAAFKIKTNSGKIIYLDPFKISNDAEKADIIVSSHGHSDHFSRLDIKKLMRETTILLGPKCISGKLEKFKGEVLNLNEVFEVDDIKVELVPAYTIQKSTHPKDAGGVGIIIETEGKTVYHAGDTELIPEMKELRARNINVALLPCGSKYTMDFEESTNAALEIYPEIVVPMHNWNMELNEYKKIMEEKEPKIKVEILENKVLKL